MDFQKRQKFLRLTAFFDIYILALRVLQVKHFECYKLSTNCAIIASVNETIRQQIKDELKTERLTQKELAMKSGVREDYVSKVLRGERVSTPQEFQSILEALSLELIVRPKQKTPIEEKLEQLTTLHGEEWLLDRLEALAVVEGTEELQ